ncbi:hypothetical protein G6F22_020484 [Rhizopus arrhizus]|nr:hypothetical protein G6F22_020484 [Rhizopus arrhizus]
MNPDVLLMDEAFSALDVLTGETLRDDMLELWDESRISTKGILIVSHNIEEAPGADRSAAAARRGFAAGAGADRRGLRVDDHAACAWRAHTAPARAGLPVSADRGRAHGRCAGRPGRSAVQWPRRLAQAGRRGRDLG